MRIARWLNGETLVQPRPSAEYAFARSLLPNLGVLANNSEYMAGPDGWDLFVCPFRKRRIGSRFRFLAASRPVFRAFLLLYSFRVLPRINTIYLQVILQGEGRNGLAKQESFCFPVLGIGLPACQPPRRKSDGIRLRPRRTRLWLLRIR